MCGEAREAREETASNSTGSAKHSKHSQATSPGAFAKDATKRRRSSAMACVAGSGALAAEEPQNAKLMLTSAGTSSPKSAIPHVMCCLRESQSPSRFATDDATIFIHSALAVASVCVFACLSKALDLLWAKSLYKALAKNLTLAAKSSAAKSVILSSC